MTDRGLLRLLTVLLAALMSFGAVAVPAALADTPTSEEKAHAPNGPPDKPDPQWLKQWNDRSEGNWGVDTNGHWCMMPEANNCTFYKQPDTYDSCEEHNVGCDDPKITEERKKRELAKLAEWEKATDHGAYGYQKMDAAIRKCIEGGQNFHECQQLNAQLMVPDGGPVAWVEGKISKMASDALKEAAGAIGEGVVWLLQQFADSFNDVSTIDLGKVGIDKVTGTLTVLSVLVAAFLALVQFARVAVSQQGAPLATVLKGLGKYALVLGVYAGAAQVVLNWIDQVSIWIINLSFKGGGDGKADAAAAMKTQLGALFSGLVASGGTSTALISGGGVMSQAVGVVIVLGILSILVIGALWIEMFLRQAGIMILMAAMPIALAGQLGDETQDWWPKARRAFTALAFSKLAIVVCFAIGFNSMGESQGVRNVIVGLIVFLLAAFAWPVLARFLTMVEAGGGNSVAAGMVSSIGSSVGAMFGGFAGGSLAAAGAGAVGGGSGYTKALEEETSSGAPNDASGEVTQVGPGSGKRFLKGDPSRSFASKLGGVVGTGLQLAAAGAATLEGAAANTAANAGLGAPGSGHATVVPPRKGGGAAPPVGEQKSGGADAPAEPKSQGSGPASGSSEADLPVTAVSGGPVSDGATLPPQTGGTTAPAPEAPAPPEASATATPARGTPAPPKDSGTDTPPFGVPVWMPEHGDMPWRPPRQDPAPQPPTPEGS
ncbi:hypothetical protein GCM10018790_77890 [Kitasatospora xanthocidica]|uniref:hypothetical protein n=1 Tax=Kitasatospora xanthocidica TaxID=83382 RepID=UPI001675CF49|nr:hypothetical protein [Kitasatospora xanthocidica]GHF88949.1 hypothetical protein GCM10018790_77890 [Kitasatospora xanthocidica]